MMSVKEYAVDVNKSIEFILNLCNEMNINVNNEEDMLDDDAIIILDNEIVNRADEDYEEQIEDSYLEELEEIGKKEENIAKKKQKHKEKNKEENNDKADYLKQRKQMYKSKDKLQSNKEVNDDNTILYSEGMTISKLSGMLNVGVGEILKKVMLLGMMMNINSIIDFDTAEIIVSDYGKTLKKVESLTESYVGCAWQPQTPRQCFCACRSDGIVSLIDCDQSENELSYNLESIATCCRFSNDGKHLCVGTIDENVSVLTCPTLASD